MRARVDRARYVAGMILLGLADALEEAAAKVLPRR